MIPSNISLLDRYDEYSGLALVMCLDTKRLKGRILTGGRDTRIRTKTRTKIKIKTKSLNGEIVIGMKYGCYRARTCDPQLVRLMLYQLS